MTPSACVEIDGLTATAEGLQHRALVNYGHFTAMQVRNRRVRGLDLHLARLTAATLELFGVELTAERVRALLRHALSDHSSASVRIDVHQPTLASGDVSVMISVRPPAEPPDGPQRLQTVEHVRPLPHIKHVGTFAQIHFGTQTERRGFDDALFVRDDGHVLETTIANIGFVEGDSVVWPSGPMLCGITWQLLERCLPAGGTQTRRRVICLRDLPAFRATFLTNSLGVAAVDHIDDLELSHDPAAIDIIRRAHEALPWDRV